MTKSRLGRGLSALIPMETDLISGGGTTTEIEISLIKPNKYQPRTNFNEEKLQELAESIKEHGVVQPVVVRRTKDGNYELVVGERRLRACQKLNLEKIPAVIKELSEQQMIEIALIENIQRHDLNPLEEALAYKRLVQEFNLTQEQVAQRVGKSRPVIANMIRLLNLPDSVLDKLAEGTLTVGHVRPLLAIEDQFVQSSLAQDMIDKKMTVRDAETVVQEILEKSQQVKEKNTVRQKPRIKTPPLITELESRLRSLCGTKVRIKQNGDRGKIEIEFYSNDDLDRIINLFSEYEH